MVEGSLAFDNVPEVTEFADKFWSWSWSPRTLDAAIPYNPAPLPEMLAGNRFSANEPKVLASGSPYNPKPLPETKLAFTDPSMRTAPGETVMTWRPFDDIPKVPLVEKKPVDVEFANESPGCVALPLVALTDGNAFSIPCIVKGILVYRQIFFYFSHYMSDFGYGKFSLLGRTDRVNQLGFVSLVDGRNNAYIGLYAGASRPQAGTNNTFVGSYSGSNTAADSSTFVGTATGRRASKIKETCFIGYKAGELAERIESSICVGAFSGRKMTRANCNTLLGYQSGAELTSGSRNTILGAYAAYSQFNAHDNVCIGHRSGYKNTIGSNNCYIGTNSGFAAYQGYDNVALGVKSGEGLTSGHKNVLVGYGAGANISGASNCIAMGTQAMEFFYNGDTNTCVGTQAARRFTGFNNTILGGYSTSNASGNYNTIVGSRSMNRRTGDRVALSNCVILGENIQFDIPVRIVTAYANEMDVIPDAQIGNENVNTMIFSTPSRTFVGLNLVPVGDPMLVKERFISLGTPDFPVNFDTSYAGTYKVEWGSEVLNDNTMVGPIPVRLSIDVPSASQSVHVTLEAYDEFVDSWTLDNAGSLDVYLAQAFDPPSIRVKLGADVDLTFADLVLPGARILVDRIPEYDPDNGTITLFASANKDLAVPGMEIQINKSAIDALNTVWRIADVGADVDGLRPIVLDISSVEGVSGNDLGTAIEMLASRTVSRPVYGTVVEGSLAIAEPFFAGMLFGTATKPKVYVDGSGDVAAGVYSVAIVNKEAGEVALDVDLLDQEVFVGNVSIGTFESLIVGFQISTTADINGPTESDGHVHSGVGSQSQMDAEIEQGYLVFQGGGYEYATYELGAGTNTVDLSGTFDIPLSGDIDFGFKWLDHYDVKCIKDDSAVGISITSTQNGVVTDVLTFSTDVFVLGSIDTGDFPIDIVDILATPNPQMTVNVKHDTAAETLTFTIVLQGGTRFGTAFVPQGAQKKAKLIVSYVPALEGLGSTVQFYANAATKLSAVQLKTNVQNTENTTLGNFSVLYSQRSDTGLQSTSLQGPTAFDGHMHSGEGTLEDMDQDIRSNVLTFSNLGRSSADYKIGALGTALQANVTYSWGHTKFGIEWLDAYELTCNASPTAFTIDLYHAPSSTFLMSFSEDELYGRVKASIARYDASDTQIPMTYPPDIADLDPRSVNLGIDHRIKAKTLDFFVTLAGQTDTIVYTIQLTDSPPVDRAADVLSFFSYGALTASDIDIRQSNYKSYPTFEDCIFVGSNFTVGGDVAIVDKERANVFIAAIGDTRLFRGRTEEFKFFSNVVTANALTLQGGTGDVATLEIAGNESGNALHVTGNVIFTQKLDVLGRTAIDDSLAVSGPTTLQNTLVVAGAARLLDALHVTGESRFDDNAIVGGDASCVGTMTISGATQIQSTLTVSGATALHGTLEVDQAVTLNSSCDVNQTLGVTGAASFENSVAIGGSLGVTGDVSGRNAQFGGTLNVDGAAIFDNSLSVTYQLTSGSSVTGSLDAGTATLDSLNVSGGATLGGLDVNGGTTLDTTTVGGILFVNGTTYAGDDIVVTNGDVTADGIGLKGVNGAVDAVASRVSTAETDIDNLQTSLGGKLDATGGTVTGGLTVNSQLTVYGDIAMNGDYSSTSTVAVIDSLNRIRKSTSEYVKSTQLDNYLPKSGGTISGDLTLLSNLIISTSGSGTTAIITDSGNRLCKQSSSIRYKHSVQLISADPEYLDKLWTVQPVVFYYRQEMGDFGPERHGGFIAEQLDEVGFQEGVFYENEKPEALRPDAILALAVAGIQHLRTEVEALKAEVATLKTQINSLSNK